MLINVFERTFTNVMYLSVMYLDYTIIIISIKHMFEDIK